MGARRAKATAKDSRIRDKRPCLRLGGGVAFFYTARLHAGIESGSSMTDAHIENHSAPVHTPKQIIVLLVLAFLVPVVVIVMITQLVTAGLNVQKAEGAMSEEAVAQRLKPVGEVALMDANPATQARSAEQVVSTVCQACHGAGLVGAPKIGDKAAWRPRLAQGVNTLHEHAIKGVRAMPPKGGNPSLSDAEVNAAVDYMLKQLK